MNASRNFSSKSTFHQQMHINVTGFEKTQLPRTIKTFINTDFNNLKCYNSGRETDACMKFAIIL